MDLDELIAASEPATTVRSDVLERELAALVTAAETQAQSRRRWRGGLVVAAVVGVVGIGAAAGADGIWRTPPAGPWDDKPVLVRHTFTLSDGTPCVATYRFIPTGEPVADAISDDAWRDALEESQRFLKGVDTESIDIEQATAEYVRRSEAARAAAEPSERPPALGRDEARIGALSMELNDELEADLRSKNLPTNTVASVTSFPCFIDGQR